jgi:hypothetical protein
MPTLTPASLAGSCQLAYAVGSQTFPDTPHGYSKAVLANGDQPPGTAAHVVITNRGGQGATLHSYRLEISDAGSVIVRHTLDAGPTFKAPGESFETYWDAGVFLDDLGMLEAFGFVIGRPGGLVAVEAMAAHGSLCLLGEPGAGKTTALEAIAGRLSRPDGARQGPVVFVPMAEVTDAAVFRERVIGAASAGTSGGGCMRRTPARTRAGSSCRRLAPCTGTARCPPTNLDTYSASAPFNYYRYQVQKAFSVMAGRIAPWFGQPGGGIQDYLADTNGPGPAG